MAVVKPNADSNGNSFSSIRRADKRIVVNAGGALVLHSDTGVATVDQAVAHDHSHSGRLIKRRRGAEGATFV